MWSQRFPVKPENIVDERRGLKEWVICLAFPFGERLRRGESSSGIYTFFPIEISTNFPFIIHADFILSSSRETILLNNKWNMGILDCVGYAFSEAVVVAIKSDKTAPVSSMIRVFQFLPANASPYVELERVRESIRNNLEAKDIIPHETFSTQKPFCKPTKAGWIIPAFRNIISQLKAQGVPLESISSQGKHFCHSTFDLIRFDRALDFLGVQCFYHHWYAKCIQDCNLILKTSENIYVELLVFIMKNWQSQSNHIGIMATFKYIDQHGNVALCSINSASRETYKICFGLTYEDHNWLSKCNMEFGWKEMYFLPNATWSTLQRSQNRDFLKSAFKSHARMKAITLLDFFIIAVDSIRREKNSRIVISFTHFLCHSLSKYLISPVKISEYGPSIPVVDRFGHVNLQRDAVLVPAFGSKWGELMISNPWTNEKYVELGEQYAHCCKFAGYCSSKEMLHNFIVVYIKAKDIPELCPPGAHFPLVCLTKEAAIPLMKLMRAASDSILWDRFSKIADLPFIDDSYYGSVIYSFKDELAMMGVVVGFTKWSNLFTARMKLPKNHNAEATRYAFKLLNSEKNESFAADFIKAVRNQRWLKTNIGFMPPKECFLSDPEWACLLHVLEVPLIDETFYKGRIGLFKEELKSLGVNVNFDYAKKKIFGQFKSPSSSSDLKIADLPFIDDAFYGNCISSYRDELKMMGVAVVHRDGCQFVVQGSSNSALTENSLLHMKSKWILTHMGYKTPDRCFLFNSSPSSIISKKWIGSLELEDVPFINEEFYGTDISLYREELKAIGVNVEASEGCFSLTELLSCHTNFSTIRRIYSIWHANGGEGIVKGITKLPANTADGAVQLIDKRDLFIPDDLQPVQIFAEVSANPLFVWCPLPSLPKIPVSKLYMIYSSLGVWRISVSVQKGEDFSMDYSLLKVLPTTEVIRKGLLKLVLAFLADVPICTTVRLESAQSLLKLSILETTEPIMVSYSLVLPSDKRHVNAKARKTVYWEKTSNKLIIQTTNKSDNKTIMEFACRFGRVVSEGLLLKIITSLIQQRKTRTPIFDGLYKLVRLGYFLDFNVDSIECLLKIKNLEVLIEDEDFIASAFAVYNTALVVYKRKPQSVKELSAPIAEKDQTERRRDKGMVISL
ncbi:hypothetical protein CKAN_01370900 [Cinnamomum micranthum f. kanehirae]|uniref:Uncharacterized protein n=1 Tax=Cinnamomum micranthum f. kanehirae TaxID=337451 RepID=A0A443P2F0_9MAGN|nr:hypothetical protein CKAN_01370900 [Cinnamomum micranthum f. kanehirae]